MNYLFLTFLSLFALILVSCGKGENFSASKSTGGTTNQSGPPPGAPSGGTGEPGTIGGPGSGGSGNDGGTLSIFVTDQFVQQNFTQDFDFLWIVDNSGSMSNIRDYMAQNLNDFLTTLESRQALNWQMAATTTDHVVRQGNLVAATGGTRVVTKQTANAASVWASLINNITVTAYSHWEQGLEAGHSAIANYAAEFSRPGVPLVVSYVSDEQDYSCQSNCFGFGVIPETQPGWNAFATSRYVDQLIQHSNNSGANVLVYPIVHLENNPITCDDFGYQGSRYMEVQQGVGTGSNLSLCSQDLAASFNTVAQLTANSVACFTLAHTVSSTQGMQVWVDSVEVLVSSSTGYTYNSGSNQVCFSGSVIPLNGQTVEIKYLTSG